MMVDVESALDHFDTVLEPHSRYCYKTIYC